MTTFAMMPVFRKSSSPFCIWLYISASLPRVLSGKKSMVTWPLVRSLMFSQALAISGVMSALVVIVEPMVK